MLLTRITYRKIFSVITLLLACTTHSLLAEQAVAQTEPLEPAVPATEAPAIAPNLDLKEVAPLPEPVIEAPVETDPAQHSDANNTPDSKSASDPLVENPLHPTLDKQADAQAEDDKLIILGVEVPKNSSTRIAWSPQITISGLALPTPVLVIHGAKPGPTVCLTSAIHGDELNGIEVVRRVMYDIDPDKLTGTLIGVPIVNLQGFQRTSRYLSDRRDLNRFFPGDPLGSLASRIAHSLFTKVIVHCQYLVDIHTGSFRRNNLPQIRANMGDQKVAEFVGSFDKIAVVHNAGSPGMLRTVANQSGIVALTMELGESLRIQENQIEAGTYSINSMLDKLDMYPRTFIWGNPKPTYYEAMWLRAESGGILFSAMQLGDRVSEGDVLGFVTDPITNQRTELIAPVSGNIIGMAVNQFVIPGFAAYHIGIESTQEAMTNNEDSVTDAKQNSGDGIVDPE